MSMTQEENVIQVGGVESVGDVSDNEVRSEGAPGVDVVASLPLTEDPPEVNDDMADVKENEEGGKGEQEDSDSDSEDDLQLIVNDEDIYYPHGTEGVQEGEGEEMFAVAGEEHFEDMDWAAEMHSYHSQFFKYVRPGTGAAEPSAGVPDGSGPFTPGSMNSSYPVGLWGYPFETAYEFILPPAQTIFDIDVEQFEDKPWDYPGVDITDYFNFGFTEDTWKQYCEDFARAKEAYFANKMHDYEDGQGWNDNGESEPRGRGHRRNMRSIEGGANERRDMRRQRLREMQDGRSHEHQGDRRRQRNDDVQRRKGYPRQGHSTEQASPLGARLGRTSSVTQTSPGRTFPSPSRDRRSGLYTPRSRLPSPGNAKNAANGYRRHSMDSSNRPWQRSSRRHEFDDESHGSSDSDRNESEDEIRNHRLRRFSSQPLEKRLGARAEPPPNEVKSAPEKRVVKLSRYAVQEDEKKPVSELPKRLPPKVERSPAPAEGVEKRASRELVTEKRMIHTTRRLNQSTEARSSDKRATDSIIVTKAEATTEKKAEPAPERRMQSISERRAQFIAERKAEQAEKREKLLREQASEMKVETEKTKAPVKVVEKVVAEEKVILKDKSGESQEEVKSNRSVSVVKLEERVDSVKDQDLRMQVIERVCSRWKFHIRRGDARAKKKKQSMDSDGVGNEDAGKSQSPRGSYREKVEDEDAEARTRDERKRTYRDKQRQYDDDEDATDYDHPNERWQMDDAHERRRRQFGALDARDDGSLSARRSSLRHSATKRRYNDENGVVEAWAVDEDEYEGAEDNGRWNGDQARRKRRRFNYNIVEEEHYADEMDNAYNYDSRGRLYDGSTSSAQADAIYYRRTGKSYSRKSDRWTGSLYDSGGEYDER